MKTNELRELWHEQNQQIDKSVSLNQSVLNKLTARDVEKKIASMKPLKIMAVLIGLIWIIFVDSLIINSFESFNLFFLGSAIFQVLLTKMALGIYLYQIILINSIDLNEPVVTVQEKLTKLETLTLLVARVLFLQLPAWTLFHLNSSMLENGNILLYIFQVLATVSATFLAIWLSVNIKIENKDKKWFNWIFQGKEWKPLIDAMQFTEEIKSFQSK